jgi:hypothetical protein
MDTHGRALRRLEFPHEHPLTLFGDEFCPDPKTIERTLNFFDFLITTYLVPRQRRNQDYGTKYLNVIFQMYR